MNWVSCSWHFVHGVFGIVTMNIRLALLLPLVCGKMLSAITGAMTGFIGVELIAGNFSMPLVSTLMRKNPGWYTVSVNVTISDCPAVRWVTAFDFVPPEAPHGPVLIPVALYE